VTCEARNSSGEVKLGEARHSSGELGEARHSSSEVKLGTDFV
jgi:hypothetical protein